jgi:hypothetical protein
MFPISMPYVTTAKWSRRFLGLLLFLSLAAAGWVGYRKHVERSIELTELLKQQLFARGWAILNGSQVAVLCIQPPPGFGDARSIVGRILFRPRLGSNGRSKGRSSWHV